MYYTEIIYEEELTIEQCTEPKPEGPGILSIIDIEPAKRIFGIY
jgi:hypothetical protein